MHSQDRVGMARGGGGRGVRGMLVGGIAALALLAGGSSAAQAATATFDQTAVTTPETGSVSLPVTNACGTLEGGLGTTETFDVVLTPGTATTPADYGAASPATVTFTCTLGVVSQGSGSVSVQIKPDTLDEVNETFTVKLVDQANPSTTPSTATVTITDDDAAPSVTIGTPAAAVEGTSAVGPGLSFPVTLSAASGRPVSVTYATADDTAAQPADYLTSTGTLTIPAGQTTASIPVAVNADPIDEDDETLTVTIASPTNATLGATKTATGTITDDDTSTISMAGTSVNEGAAGTTTVANATVSLSTPSAKTVTVGYATAAGSATADDDYVSTTGTVTFAPGQTTGTIPVTVKGDAAVEPDEIFGITLSSPTNASITLGTAVVTIRNDDAAGGGTTTGGTTTGGGTTSTGGVTVDPGKTSTLPPPTTTTVRAPIRLSALTYKKASATMRYDVTCPDAAGRCKGTVTVFTVPVAKSKVKALRKEQKLGSKRFDLAAGQTVSLSIRLTKAAKGWLKSARSYKVIAYAVSSSTQAGVSTAKTTGTIRK